MSSTKTSELGLFFAFCPFPLITSGLRNELRQSRARSGGEEVFPGFGKSSSPRTLDGGGSFRYFLQTRERGFGPLSALLCAFPHFVSLLPRLCISRICRHASIRTLVRR